MSRAGILCAAALFSIIGFSLPHHTIAEEITRVRLDQMNIDYMGMDFNEDYQPDFIRINIITEEYTVFLGSGGGRPEKLDWDYLSEEEKRLFPDMVREVDLDGDKINELVLVNSRRLQAVWKDEKSLDRILGDVVYIGMDNSTLISLGSSSLSDEARVEFLEKVKKYLAREPALKGT